MPGMIQPERIVTWLSDDIVTVAVKSLFSGNVSNMTLFVTREQWDAWQAGTHIQHAMPNLSPAEREFLLTGATPEEWNAAFPEDDEDE